MNTEFGKVTRKRILVADTHRCPYNPPRRTSDDRLEALREEVRQAGGVILQPIAVSSDGYTLDGARRRDIAIENGDTFIEANVYEDVSYTKTRGKFDQLFVILNKGTLAYTPKDRLLTILNGGPAFTTSDANDARRIRLTLRPEALEMFMNHGAVKDAWRNPLGAARILNSGKKDTDPEVVADVNKILFWMYRHGQMENLKHWLKGYRGQNHNNMHLTFDPVKLRKAIDTNKPLPDSIVTKAAA